jgi:hypothetical protein
MAARRANVLLLWSLVFISQYFAAKIQIYFKLSSYFSKKNGNDIAVDLYFSPGPTAISLAKASPVFAAVLINREDGGTMICPD